ncbi:MAG TPA: hypothetical protein VHA30_02935, partial [Patescibacteria group bacterium]|nr:hypothetical protein [Patescibacteria group bacterium]
MAKLSTSVAVAFSQGYQEGRAILDDFLLGGAKPSKRSDLEIALARLHEAMAINSKILSYGGCLSEAGLQTLHRRQLVVQASDEKKNLSLLATKALVDAISLLEQQAAGMMLSSEVIGILLAKAEGLRLALSESGGLVLERVDL